MSEIRNVKYEYRSGTSTEAAAHNIVLSQGEPGYETDTGRIKIGDGRTAWNDLPYVLAPEGDVPALGQLSDLTTDNKSTVVAAVNELNMDGVSLALLYDNAKAG